MSAQHLFNAIFNAGLVTMLLTLIASLGMTFSVKQILQPLRRGWLLAGTMVVNTGLAPLVAIGVCHLLPLTSQARVGVEIVTIAAAGPAGRERRLGPTPSWRDVAMADGAGSTVIKINAITVPEDAGDELARRFAARAHAVDDQEGFEGFELLRPTDERRQWLVVTRWRNEESFQKWVASPAFAHGHG